MKKKDSGSYISKRRNEAMKTTTNWAAELRAENERLEERVGELEVERDQLRLCIYHNLDITDLTSEDAVLWDKIAAWVDKGGIKP